MKDKKRFYIYSALALPFIGFGVYAATLSPLNREAFFSEFKHRSAALFGGGEEEPIEGLGAVPPATAEPSPADGGQAGGGEGGREGGRRFDPAAMFDRRDADGDGKLAGDEIHPRMRENLAEMDTDGDEALSREEFDSAIRRIWEARRDTDDAADADDAAGTQDDQGDASGRRELGSE